MGKKGQNYLAWDVRVEDFCNSAALSEQLRFLLRYAVLAPSTHNTQPWQFKVGEDHIIISPQQQRTLPVADAQQRLLYFSLGAALENILIAASFFGLDLQYELISDQGSAAVRVQVLGSAEPSADAGHLIYSIPRRCTNRKPYANRPVDQSFFDLMLELSTAEVPLDIITDDPLKGRFADILLDFRRDDFANPAFRQELARYKRHNLTRSSLGIPGFAMGFSTPFSFFAPHLIRHVNVMKNMDEGFEQLLKEGTPAYVVFSLAHDDTPHWIALGRRLQRVMLEAERHDLQTAINALPRYTEPVQQLLGTSYVPQICLRVGYADAVDTHSPRFLADEVSVLSS